VFTSRYGLDMQIRFRSKFVFEKLLKFYSFSTLLFLRKYVKNTNLELTRGDPFDGILKSRFEIQIYIKLGV
jgi:hypothetical protein